MLKLDNICFGLVNLYSNSGKTLFVISTLFQTVLYITVPSCHKWLEWLYSTKDNAVYFLSFLTFSQISQSQM